MALIQTIHVLANPEHACNHEGQSQAAVQYYESGGQQWVGAMLDHVASVKAKRSVFVFDGQPVELQVSHPLAAAYYRRRLRDGELLPADDATRLWAGLPPVESHPRAALRRPKNDDTTTT